MTFVQPAEALANLSAATLVHACSISYAAIRRVSMPLGDLSSAMSARNLPRIYL
jgi:hypothetical protein